MRTASWPAERAIVELVANGDLRVLRPLPGASNATFFGEVSDGSVRAPVVYKPRVGETPLWDFPEGTLCSREVAAYALAEALRWPAVPPTVLRDGPHGVGAVQLFVHSDPAQHFFTLREGRSDDFRRFAAFDAVANNADRKSGHCLLGRDGTIWGIDHGVCFGVRPNLRTVIWDFAGEPLPPGVVGDVRRVAMEIVSGPLGEELARLLDEDEVRATAARAADLADSGRFPQPGAGRVFPWPPV